MIDDKAMSQPTGEPITTTQQASFIWTTFLIGLDCYSAGALCLLTQEPQINGRRRTANNCQGDQRSSKPEYCQMI